MKIILEEYLISEAIEYASISKKFTSNRHDFHEGGLSAKERKMYEGKLGEKAIKKLFIDNNIKFIEDSSSHEEADFYDFIVFTNDDKQLKIDVKTRTQDFHIRTLEMVEQFNNKPKDIYISVRLYHEVLPYVQILGFTTNKQILRINRIENNGYLDNYVLFDNELKEISILINNIKKNE
jgi:hypothetical protein